MGLGHDCRDVVFVIVHLREHYGEVETQGDEQRCFLNFQGIAHWNGAEGYDSSSLPCHPRLVHELVLLEVVSQSTVVSQC